MFSFIVCEHLNMENIPVTSKEKKIGKKRKEKTIHVLLQVAGELSHLSLNFCDSLIKVIPFTRK